LSSIAFADVWAEETQLWKRHAKARNDGEDNYRNSEKGWFTEYEREAS
jgi:hypothetical protein